MQWKQIFLKKSHFAFSMRIDRRISIKFEVVSMPLNDVDGVDGYGARFALANTTNLCWQCTDENKRAKH